MTELDKFKRRLIRSVARLLLQEKRPEEEVWETLRKETGSDCKLLWQRMRALTIKKLNRLLAANDDVASLATVARLTLTDWLLFDLVLVHEPIDLIGQESGVCEKNVDAKPLWDLFGLVQQHRIESCLREQLPAAWTDLAVAYNNQDRQCSPMLLQKRWYQLKETTRNNFYLLWLNYRGNAKLWERARHNAPSLLQMAIAKMFPHVITKPFLSWEKMIEEGLVVMPEQIETRIKKSKKPAEDASDVVMIEPQIETIDLGADSDNEDSQNENSNTATSTDFNTNIIIKQEPLDEDIDGLSNIKILDATHVPEEDTINCMPSASEIETEKSLRQRTLALQMSKFMESTQSFVKPSESNDDIEESSTECDDLINAKAQEYCKRKTVGEELVSDIIETKAEVHKQKLKVVEDFDEETNDLIQAKANLYFSDIKVKETYEKLNSDDLIKSKADEYCQSQEKGTKEKKLVEIEEDKAVQKTKFHKRESSDSDVELHDDLIRAKADEYCRHEKNILENRLTDTNEGAVHKEPEVNPDSDDSDIEFTDDLIKVKADEYCKSKEVQPIHEESKPEEETDFMDDIIKQKAEDFIKKTDINKLVTNVVNEFELPPTIDIVDDEGMKFIDDGIEYVEDEDETSKKPDPTTVTPDIKSEVEDDSSEIEPGKIDLKLLMCPVVYTTRLDQMHVFTINDFKLVNDSNVLAHAFIESKPVSKKSVPDLKNEEEVSQALETKTFETNNDLSDNESHQEVSENLKVKNTSYLLQKPRSRSYNPIQLCKNPDFNTRLKRLNIGFFTSMRNRQLLKACKPLTIDLHKAFESKLVDGTLYLKSSGECAKVKTVEEEDQSKRSAVIPSAMPIQSLMDATVEVALDKPTYLSIESWQPTANTVDLTSDAGSHDDVAERSKIINLRDLSEIRRINQRLLTAEVPPLRVSPPSPPRAAAPSLGPTQPPGGAGPLLAEGDLLAEGEPRRARGRPVSQPGLRPGPKSSKVQSQPKTKLSPYLVKATPAIPVPWNATTKAKPTRLDEFLITIDTLNKMINKMNGTDLFNIPKNMKQLQPILVSESDPSSSVPVSTDDTSSSKNAEEEPSKTVPSLVMKKKSLAKWKKKAQREPSSQYCCWSRERLSRLPTNTRTRRKHLCVRICECCCRAQLAEQLRARGKNPGSLIRPQRPAGDAIVLSDDDDPVQRIRSFHEGMAPPLSSELCTAVESISNKYVGRGLRLTVGSVTSHQGERTCTVPVVAQSPPFVGIQSPTSVSSSISDTMMQMVSSNVPLKQTKNVCNVAIQTSTTDVSLLADAPNIHTITPNDSSHISIPIAPTLQEIVSTNIQTQTITSNEPSMMDSSHIPIPTAPKLKAIAPNIPSIRPKVPIKVLPKIVSRGRGRPRTIRPPDCTNFTIVSNSESLKDVRPKKNERVLLLHSKSILHKPAESPIFLGKNKILLSTVKFPRDVLPAAAAAAPAPEPEPTATVVPTLPLPQGVSLVLLPGGELQYRVDPGVELTEEQLAVIPTIIEAVRQQINTSQFQPTASDAPQESSPVKKTGWNNGTDIDKEIPLINKQGCTEVDSLESDHDTNTSEHTHETITMSGENTIEVRREDEGKECNTGGRNLLSDLMEMSGISAADATPAVQEPMNTSVPVDPASNLLEQFPQAPGLNPVNQPLELQIPLPQNTTVPSPLPPSNLLNLPELSPITSLRELKYACEKDANFFKLDLDTGIIVPINVAIKRTVKVPSSTKPDAFIDLTEDSAKNQKEMENTSIVVSHVNDSDVNYQVNSEVLKSTFDGTTAVKPLKLFRSIRKVKPGEMERIKSKRKQQLCLVKETDSVDLLGESSNYSSKKRHRKKKTIPPETVTVSDDSDDEPLAVKSKRMKEVDAVKVPADTTDQIEHVDNIEKSDMATPGDMIDEVSTDNNAVQPVAMPNESLPENIDGENDEDNMEIEELDEALLLDDIENQESQDEDCILGV